MKVHDGLKLIVGFYDNHGCLKQVSERSGVSVSALDAWVNKGVELSPEDRNKLEATANKALVSDGQTAGRRTA